MQKFFFTCFLCLVTSTLLSQANLNTYTAPAFPDAARIEKIKATKEVVDKLFKEQAERAHYPALVYGVVADGQLVYTGEVGFTDIDKKIKADISSAFRIASMSKSVTAMAILQLRDAGKLQLDDPAYKYIPELKKVKYLTSDAPHITVRHLLTHAAGFPEDNPWGDRQLADSDAEMLKTFADGVSFSNIPGVAFEYSNMGFALLGKIISNITGKPYQLYITDNIFKPLGMNNTWWEYTKVPAAKLAHGYRWVNGNWREEELLHDGSYGAMGGLITSIEDFSKYMMLHMNAWPAKDGPENKVLKRSSIREMQHPWMFSGLFPRARMLGQTECPLVSAYGYGLGWIKDCNNIVSVGHSGGLPGFGSNWRFLPDYNIGVVSYANLTYAGTGGVTNRVMDTILKMTDLKPRQWVVSPILKQRQEQLIKLLPEWKKAEQSGIFAENFFADYIVDSLSSQAARIFAEAGKIVRVHDMIAENNLRGSFIMEGEKGKVQVFFTLTPENPALIQEYRIRAVK